MQRFTAKASLSMPSRVVPLALGVALLLSGCIVEAPAEYVPPPPRGGEPASVAAPIQARSGARLGDKLEIVSVQVTPGSVAPGRPARVTIVFRVLEELNADLRVFIHAEDPANKAPRLIFDHAPAQGRHPTTQWKKGETVRDEFQINLPSRTQARALNLWGGLWDPQTDVRLTLSNPNEVRHDGRHRVLLVQVPVAEL
jgi:hypothetical protein